MTCCHSVQKYLPCERSLSQGSQRRPALSGRRFPPQHCLPGGAETNGGKTLAAGCRAARNLHSSWGEASETSCDQSPSEFNTGHWWPADPRLVPRLPEALSAPPIRPRISAVGSLGAKGTNTKSTEPEGGGASKSRSQCNSSPQGQPFLSFFEGHFLMTNQ